MLLFGIYINYNVFHTYAYFYLDLGKQTPDVSMDYNYMMYYMQLPTFIRARIGHQFSDFIKGCTFRQKDCLDERYTYTKHVHIIIIPADLKTPKVA